MPARNSDKTACSFSAILAHAPRTCAGLVRVCAGYNEHMEATAMATVFTPPASVPNPLDALSAQANALFDARIAALVTDKDPQDFVAIDAESGDYEVDAHHNLASDRLQARHPDARLFVRRVGDECAYEITGGTIEW